MQFVQGAWSFISHCINISSTVDGPVVLTAKARSKVNIILLGIDLVWILLTKAGRVAGEDSSSGTRRGPRSFTGSRALDHAGEGTRKTPLPRRGGLVRLHVNAGSPFQASKSFSLEVNCFEISMETR